MTDLHNKWVQICAVFVAFFNTLTFGQWISLIVVFISLISALINWRYKHLDYVLKKQQVEQSYERKSEHSNG